jgi:hypothetical protein
MLGFILILVGLVFPVAITIWAAKLAKTYGSSALGSAKAIIFLVIFYAVGIGLILFGISQLAR